MRSLAIGVAALALLAGCGNQDATSDSTGSAGPTPSASPTASADPANPKGRSAAEIAQLPTCGSVWRSGKVLPRDYDACRVGTTLKEPLKKGCSSGQTMVIHTMHWFSVPGGTIGGGAGAVGHKAAIQALRDCRG